MLSRCSTSPWRNPHIHGRMPSGRRQSFTGLTLIELLVVMAIIALLAAVAWPAYQNMTASSQSARCASNLRQIGAAAHQFANENDGRLLTWGEGIEYPQRLFPRWPQGLAPTLGQTGLEAQWLAPMLKPILTPLMCPACPPRYGWGGGFTVTYAVNAFGFGWPKVKLQQISRPSSTIYLADGYGGFWTSSDMVDAGWPPPVYPPPLASVLYFPHRGKCNALFVDGHVEQFSNSIPAANFQRSP